MSLSAKAGLTRVSSGRSAIPIVRQLDPPVGPAERGRLAGIAAKLLRDDPALASSNVLGPLVRPGLTESPAVLFGDHREIGLFGDRPAQSMEHRIALLASEGDLLAVERACPAHERYLSQLLGLSQIRVVAIGPPPPGKIAPVASRCRKQRFIFGEFVTAATRAGRFQIIPHIGAGSAWTLAGEIARETGVPVAVAAAPPRLTRQVNDKIWFAHRVREVLGPRALPPTFSAYGPAAVAARIAHVARTCERVIIKAPDSAGSLGNVTIDAELIRRLDLGRVRNLVLTLLRGRGWRGGFPLLVGVWELDAMASPSVQIWVPAPGQGTPIIEGIFEQRLAGPGAQFVGAVPALLSERITDEMASDALRLAILFQDLGYFGRCSFDCLITASAGGEPEVRWIECNGRWGGVSVPMTLINRMFGNHAKRGVVIVQDSTLALSVRRPEAVHDRLGPLLLRRGKDHGVIPLSAHWLERGRGVHLVSVAASQAEAERLAADSIARLVASP